MTHADFVPKHLKGLGVEIGAYESPVPGIDPIYVDKFAEFAGKPCRADYFGEAIDLPFLDDSLDYLVASHVLEHSANPVGVLAEWYRVLKPSGIAYIIVPDKRQTWDRGRPDTTLEHMVDDYLKNTTDCDPTHIDDFVFGIDWKDFAETTDEAELEALKQSHAASYREQIERGDEINIHFHVFTPGNFRSLISDAPQKGDIPYDWDIVAFEERFPDECQNGILAILRKRSKTKWRRPLPAAIRRLANPSFPMTRNAKRFAPAASASES